jgi:hypothetical protein
MKFQGFVGPTYQLESVNVDCQRCVNWYPEIIESGTGKEGSTLYYKSTPGLVKQFEVGTGPIRLVLVDDPIYDAAHPLKNPPNRIFVVSGSEMYKATFEDDAWTATKLGDLESSSGPVSGVSIKADLGLAVFVDGVNSYIYHHYDTGDALYPEDFGTFATYGYIPVPNATQVIWVDGYFIYNQGNTGQFFVSEWGSFTVDPLSFASAEGDPDNLLSMLSNNRYLWLLNERTTEVWSNTGNADFPFERVQGGFIEKGIAAAFSAAKIDGFVFWLGRDASGMGTVYMAQGLTPQRISTHAIEQAISKYADITTAKAYTYAKDGHSFYVLNFDEATWVFDLSTKMWHERAYLFEGELQRHRSEYGVYNPHLNLHMAGDYANNKVYSIDSQVRTDDGDAIARVRTAPHISSGGKNIFHRSLTLDMETGVGLDGSGQGSDPQVMLQFSNDGGHTWSSEMWASAGKKIGMIGDFKHRVQWRRLGRARDRVYKITATDPVNYTLIGADLDVEVGVS